MGSVAGSVLEASGIASGSGSIAVGAASGSSAVGSVDLEAGFFVRYYASYDEMKNAPENSRYNTAITFSITRENAIAISNEAETTGRNFGQYNLFINNCTQHASNALSQFTIHNS